MTEPDHRAAGRVAHCAVLGSPIAHSLSPALHRAGYAWLGLDWDYQRHEVVAAELAGFVARCEAEGGWRGLSMTMPLKEAALELGTVDATAELAGAANTLIWRPDGSRAVFNTDVAGLVDALAGAVTGPTAAVLGGGATARSTLVSLQRLGVREVDVVARTPQRARQLAPLAERLELRLTVHPWAGGLPRPVDVLVSTTPAGAADGLAEAAAEAARTVFDVSYHPWPTRLASAALARGRTVRNGLDLLVHQAVGQLELMTGSRVPPDVLYAALEP